MGQIQERTVLTARLLNSNDYTGVMVSELETSERKMCRCDCDKYGKGTFGWDPFFQHSPI